MPLQKYHVINRATRFLRTGKRVGKVNIDPSKNCEYALDRLLSDLSPCHESKRIIVLLEVSL